MRRRKSPSTEIEESVRVEPPSDTQLEKDSIITPSTTGFSYRIAKWAILRLMALIYLVAFLGAHYQNEGLMGRSGLVPAIDLMEHLKNEQTSSWKGFLQHPSIFCWIPFTDELMHAVIYLGILLSLLVLLGVNSWLIQFLLWLLDFSIVTSAEGTSFYQYGWESQVLETGFLCIFLCALPHLDSRNRLQLELFESKHRRLYDVDATEPSIVVLWLFQWLCFRISVGAGLIKVRGSSCWTDKTCLHYHFETQPIPSPLSFVYHFAPAFLQRRMIDTDLMVQLYTAGFVLFPGRTSSDTTFFARVARFLLRIGGFIQAGFMVGILLSGNFAFLNHLTIIPALACLDDACWPKFLTRHASSSSSKDFTSSQGGNIGASGISRNNTWSLLSTRRVVDAVLLLLIGFLSWPVVTNLLQLGGGRQLMNASFGSFRLVNTYGAFGSVGKARYEAIIAVSDDGKTWKELQLPCKPGDVKRRPCFCAPYHYRLDWNIWFIGFKPHQAYLRNRESWLYNLLGKILEKDVDVRDRPWLALLDGQSADFLLDNYYQHGKAPRFSKVDMYHYKMAASLWKIMWQTFMSNDDVVWWTRKFEEGLVPPVEITRGRLQLAQLQ